MSPRQSSPLSLEFILLGFLLEKSVHGYDLYRDISRINDLSEVCHIKQSQLYALLEKLEAAGLVSSTHVTTESFIARREYKATPEGKNALGGDLIIRAVRSHPLRSGNN
jgi:DNA-binding PadR family transcriptional regulator